MDDDDFVTQYVTNIDPPADDDQPSTIGLALILIVGGAFAAMVIMALVLAVL